MNDHQRMMLSMLKDLDAVCKGHGIRYQLFSGTALGAVRHGGFIPWDDDLDVVMLRADYDRFLSIAAKEMTNSTYFIQREFTAHWPMQFSKLRRNNTTCMEKYYPKDPEIHQGVYIDIFPCDNLSDFKPMRWIQFLSSKVVISKALDARGYVTDNFLKKTFMILCRPLPSDLFWRITACKREASSKMVHTFFGAGSKYKKNVFERSWFEQSISIPFEDSSFPVSEHCDEILTILYGDYLRIPEQREREVKQHVAILDLHRSYADYLEQQKTMVFDVYTRSIR